MASNGPGVCIKSSACGKSDNDSDSFAFVEIFRGRSRLDRKQSNDCSREQTTKLPHRVLLLLPKVAGTRSHLSLGWRVAEKLTD
jgi:hypothetical protein